jgi:hypothetical protein
VCNVTDSGIDLIMKVIMPNIEVCQTLIDKLSNENISIDGF